MDIKKITDKFFALDYQLSSFSMRLWVVKEIFPSLLDLFEVFHDHGIARLGTQQKPGPAYCSWTFPTLRHLILHQEISPQLLFWRW